MALWEHVPWLPIGRTDDGDCAAEQKLLKLYVCEAVRLIPCARSLRPKSRDDAGDEDDAGLKAACDYSVAVGASLMFGLFRSIATTVKLQ